MNLSKKQQYIILGAICGIGALALLFLFVVQPMIDKKAEDIKKAEELEGKNKKMKDEVRQRQEIENQLENCKSTLIKFDEYIPKPILGNYLLKMEEYINHCTEGLPNIVIKDILDNDRPELKSSGGDVVFRLYRVRVIAVGGYNDLVRFVYKLQEGNPLLTISGMSISGTSDASINRLEIVLIVSWLIWNNPFNRPEFLVAAESNRVDAVLKEDTSKKVIQKENQGNQSSSKKDSTIVSPE
jgi:Tfp pilus assembly protein PilO